MSKILKAITILFLIIAVAFVAGCAGNDEQNNPSLGPASLDPKLVISPHNKFPSINAGEQYNGQVNINSTLGDAYNITLYDASGDENLGVYIDGKEGGPFEVGKLSKGTGQSVNLSIQTPSNIDDDKHTVLLKATYYDINHNIYETSTNIPITVEKSGLLNL